MQQIEVDISINYDFMQKRQKTLHHVYSSNQTSAFGEIGGTYFVGYYTIHFDENR